MSNSSNLKLRIMTAMVLIPLVIYAIYFCDVSQFTNITAILTGLSAWEWARLSGLQQQASKVLYGAITAVIFLLLSIYAEFYPAFIWCVTGFAVFGWCSIIIWLFYQQYKGLTVIKSKTSKLMIGCWLLLSFAYCLLELKTQQEYNAHLIISACLLVWVGDSAAYFVGRKFGRDKLADKISPGKTWAGFWAQIVAGAIVFSLTTMFTTQSQALYLVLIAGAVLSGVAISGDLFESIFKRQANIKDSSNLLPGHGGILDRIDSLLSVIPIYTFVYMIFS